MVNKNILDVGRMRENALLKSLGPEQKTFIQCVTSDILLNNESGDSKKIRGILSDAVEKGKRIALPTEWEKSITHWEKAISILEKNHTITLEDFTIMMKNVFSPEKKFILSYYKLNRIMYTYCALMAKNIYKRICVKNAFFDRLINISFRRMMEETNERRIKK